jgi:hypothetical protein
MLSNSLAFGTASLLLAQTAIGQDANKGMPSPTFSAEVAVGVEYDSNVSVEEVDATSGESDHAIIVDLELGMDQQINDRTDLSLSYDFSNSKYNEFDQVDRQTHILGADLAYDAGDLNTGISAYYIDARLDSDGFLELWRVSPSLSGFISKRWFARGAYVYSDKTLDERPERDAQTHAGEADLYFFRRGLRSYFNVGYQFKYEDAEAAQYDYRAHNFKLRYIHRLEMFSRLAKIEFSWRFEDRDYQSDTPSIGEERDDSRNRWKVDLEYPVTDQATIQLYGGYADYESNLPAADYYQTVVGTRFLYSW